MQQRTWKCCQARTHKLLQGDLTKSAFNTTEVSRNIPFSSIFDCVSQVLRLCLLVVPTVSILLTFTRSGVTARTSSSARSQAAAIYAVMDASEL